MNFQPELAAKVMAREKTVTRRLVSANPRSPWYAGGCSLRVGQSYAVCPGRGKDAIGRVTVTDVAKLPLGHLGLTESRREGFANWHEFETAWTAINGTYDSKALVWRVEFKVAS